MIKVFSCFLMFFNIFFGYANTIPGNEYMDEVNDSFEEYYIVEDQKLVVGDYTLVFGKYKEEYYLSCYLYNEGVTNNQKIRIIVNDISITTYVPDSSVVAGFGLKLNTSDSFKVLVIDDSNELEIGTYRVSDLVDELIKNKIIGNGSGNFPKNKREVDAVNTIKMFLFGFIILSILFVVILVILYKNRVGTFNEKHKLEPLFGFEKEYGEEDEDVIDVEEDNYEVQQVNKQEVMDRLFEEYRHGDITEEELNEKLKKLWWQEND